MDCILSVALARPAPAATITARTPSLPGLPAFAGQKVMYARTGKGANIRKCTILSIGIPRKYMSTDGRESVFMKHNTATTAM